MHIPDGYLSPSTCALTFAAAAPFWYVASRNVTRMLHTKAVPLISVVSAFSFTVMMFNLPLPGGTTGHAVGMAIAAIVLGPWAAIMAISIALLVQAVFFGDGGILAFGANAFNMAIVGSLTAYAVYRLIAGASALSSRRRVVAGAIAGYVAINISALVASIEFGLQPMFFHDAAGAPLFAPYPLSIAVPAMMIGHLTFAGLAELTITGGLVAYLQRYDIDLLKQTAHRAVLSATGRETGTAAAWKATRRLWAGLAALMIASPLGLIAAGTAWGEWAAEDFADPQARAEIAAASGNAAPPEAVPSGLHTLSSLWTAPMPDYAPPFMHSAEFGYVLSALTGGGLIILIFLALSALAGRMRQQTPDAA
jgi:cobalt/nickel transport system permease protein